ncbi:MAG: transaldolase [Candidatus Omnitrophica bacterium]|nr:transaldolase [Candidatus Omnitrophota bacterium]
MPKVQKQDTWNMEVEERLNPLKALYRLGQSPWYDNIERRLFKTREFNRLINEYGIVGVTSNPTIFDKAIRGSSDYDEQIQHLVKAKKKSYQIYDELTIKDVATAADMLSKIYKNTNGLDGYVSIEVLPEYAYDSKKTVSYAKKLFKRLNRKNILIKVPGTKQGIPAIRELIAEGINVNVTLLFSVSQYEAIAKAYIEGLNNRLRKNKKLEDVASVASMFISRIDTKIDKILEEKASKETSSVKKEKILGLRGKAAVANSKIIYQRFKGTLLSNWFRELTKKGGKVQRVLWASTSTKNPNYRDVKYVEELIGPHSINTIPHQTVFSFYDHGLVKPTIEEGIAEAKEVLDELNALGIDIEKVCDELQEAGVKAFIGSFNSLIKSIEEKVKRLS